jgi:hypothetical protein
VFCSQPYFHSAIFEMTDENYHGGAVGGEMLRSRTCFAVYYPTLELPGGKAVVPHTSIDAASADCRRGPGIRQLATDLTPPMMLSAFRS